MIQRIEIVLSPEEATHDENFKNAIAKKIGVSKSATFHYQLAKRSIDARSRDVKIRMFFDVSIDEELKSEEIAANRNYQDVTNAKPIYIVGAGPAGLFAALQCIELGHKPIIIERGKDVRSRRRDLADINKKGIVDPDSNYCFGEGGAGTYSDGKLYTRSDKRGNVKRVLQTFVEFGASPEIMIDAHPHIGTNKLPGIVTALREKILECGGEVLFNTKLTGIQHQSNQLKSIEVTNLTNSTSTKLVCDALIVATGHSARDIFELFKKEGITIERKDFALGVRIEHPQQFIDSVQYHCDNRGEYLPPAAYSLTGQYNGRGVYTFCMCPGGIIAPASTAPGEIVVNGWSPSKRNNAFANSGLVVSVGEEEFKEFEKQEELAALAFQRSIEQKCFNIGNGSLAAPAQRVVDFCSNKQSSSLPLSSYIPGLNSTMLKDVLPEPVTKCLQEALVDFGKKMKGYFTNDAVLVATESRTSSPVRIPRNREDCMHIHIKGIFPCGEGAGYAGGIVSAAMDGERCAEFAAKMVC
jgi:uncharacterized FAD-dependent dehydrogenase